MIENVDDKLQDYLDAGADIISIHVETTNHLDRLINQVKQHGCKACVAINPATSLNRIEYVIDKLDMILLLGVNPGYGGQKLLPYIEQKITYLQEILRYRNLNISIQIDGGVNISTIERLRKVGANIFVAGSAVFSEEGNLKDNIDRLMEMKKS